VIPTPRSPYARLLAEPKRFRFDAAMRILARAKKTPDFAQIARFRTPPGLGYPPADILTIDPPADSRPHEVVTAVMGLTGTSGVLPRAYTDVVTKTLRNRSAALHDFLDMLSHRFVAFFARAGEKYRINRCAETAATANPPEPDRVAEALLAFSGYATPHLTERLTAGVDPLLHYSGLFAGRPRSAEKLTALVSDWLGRKVEVAQFAGAWLALAPDQQSSLAAGLKTGAWSRLGIDAAIGVRAWDLQARIILQRLVSLVRAFLGYEIGFAVNPVLSGPEVPPLSLDPSADPPARLGWNSWIPAPEGLPLGISRADAADALFEAEIVEAEELARRIQQTTPAGDV